MAWIIPAATFAANYFLSDSADDKAAESSQRATDAQLAGQREALDYTKQVEAPVLNVRNQALNQLSSMYGLTPFQAEGQPFAGPMTPQQYYDSIAPPQQEQQPGVSPPSGITQEMWDSVLAQFGDQIPQETLMTLLQSGAFSQNPRTGQWDMNIQP